MQSAPNFEAVVDVAEWYEQRRGKADPGRTESADEVMPDMGIVGEYLGELRPRIKQDRLRREGNAWTLWYSVVCL
jgi:hypothetical protein